MKNWIVEIVLLGAALAWLVYVNRLVFRQRVSLLMDAPLSVVLQVMAVSPDSPFKMAGIRRIEWLDDTRTTARVIYENGAIETLVREIEIIPGRHAAADGAFVSTKDGVVLGTFHTESVFSETPAGVLVECEAEYTRGAFRRGFNLRLRMPFAFVLFKRGIEPQLKAYCVEHHPECSGRIQTVGSVHEVARRLGGWPFLLSASAVLWFVFDLGLWPGLILIATILIHEGGHLFSMRRHGLQASAVLIPFFGGMAYSSKPMPSDASDAEMILMGPAFGLAFAFALFGVSTLVTEADFWAVAAGFAMIVNGFNLLPIPPLDGGRYVQLMIRRLGHETFRWLSLALVACGGALAWWLSSLVLTVIFVIFGVLLAITREQNWDRPLMSAAEMALSSVGFLALIVGHLWIFWLAAERDIFDQLFRVLQSGPFG
jgi:Zn-dependent protease